MRTGEHRNVGPFGCPVTDFTDQLFEKRVVDIVHRIAQGGGCCGVVDILRGEAEVDELLVLFQAESVHLLLDEVLHRFYVVVGPFFDLFDPEGILFREVTVEVAKFFEMGRVHALQLRQGQSAEGDEVFYLHADPVADKGIFREVFFQRGGGGTVTTVDGRDGCDAAQFHELCFSL